MSYTKTNWLDRSVQYPSKFTSVTNADGTITLTPSPGTITQAGTPITAAALNNLETQYDNAVTDIEKWVATQPSWISATLQNGWVDYGGGFSNAQYFKDNMGFVHIKGLIKNGTTTTGTTIFTLPTGYRPLENKRVVALANDTLAEVAINADGTIQIISASSGWLSIDSTPAFLAEQ